jgi:hypothetical protein
MSTHPLPPRLTLVFGFCLGLLTGPAQAGRVYGHVVSLLADESDSYFVYLDQPVVNPAACGTQTASTNRFVVQPSTPGGQAQIATVLEAMALGRPLWVVGRGDFPASYPASAQCNIWPDTESVNYIQMQ